MLFMQFKPAIKLSPLGYSFCEMFSPSKAMDKLEKKNPTSGIIIGERENVISIITKQSFNHQIQLNQQ